MKLKSATIYKYKSINEQQTFEIDEKITVLVGMNEAGKTGILEALAKFNYFSDDIKFTYDATHDYPRKEKKALDKSKEDAEAVQLSFEIDQILADKIQNDLGKDVFDVKKVVSYTRKYSGKYTWQGVRADLAKFIDVHFTHYAIEDSDLATKLKQCYTKADFTKLLATIDKDVEYRKYIEILAEYYENKWNWENDPISEYVARTYLKPNTPKFLYYDEYYSLPSEVIIEELQSISPNESDEKKTAKALFDLAEINVSEITKANNFENFIAELEATQSSISEELFKYWSANENLKIRFAIEKTFDSNNYLKDHRLNIRVYNTRTDMTLPLKNRSKGFNWFFSFLVWFKKIQEDKNSNYILLLDEPGLNLHATAQADLLRFLEDLAKEYQIIYTTHSPFMIDPLNLQSVRTVLESSKGTKISESIQERDPKTLFPLQAALGYEIAQNLFIGKNNLIVEGPSDLIYLTVVSDILKSVGRNGLSDKITVTPVGGLDKVTTFIALLGANQLNIVCLLDTVTDSKGKAKLEDLVKSNIIKQKNILYFDAYTAGNHADIEDIFSKSEYLALFNKAFFGEYEIKENDLDKNIPTILGQIAKHIQKQRFNHFRPARTLAASGLDSSFFSADTLDRFEKIFKEVNALL